MPPNRTQLLAAAVLVISLPVHAAPPDANAEPAPKTSVRELAPAQLSAIRAIGRNVLAAKKSAVDDPADAEQLGSLRTAVNTLVAAELNADDRASITVQGGEAPTRPQAHALAAEQRNTARADARALAAQLRQHGGVLASRALAGVDSGTASAGLPVAGQRAQLFDRLAQKLDAALADGEPERLAKLLDLQQQLSPSTNRLRDAPPVATPTLQAMPSTSATPIRAVGASEAKPQVAPVKAKPRKPKAK
ncbi:hypothetical protein [Thiobacillus denitrificans]|uniref:hypothetical protein n=1 Tax=Thiobacillus denitrificans TaxID=36861 RepID=UPI0003626CCB|nr:hypothetical protein [Thiobacillus denitrificans]